MTTPPSNFHAWQLGFVDAPRIHSALDVGCGKGQMVEALRTRIAPGALLLALDIHEQAIHNTRQHTNIDCVRATAEDLPVVSGQFDLVTAGHVLPLVTNMSKAVNELRRVLAPRGTLLASVNSETSGERMLAWHIEACQRAGRSGQAARATASSSARRFSLENGTGILSRVFKTVEVQTQETALIFRTIDALLKMYVGGLHMRGTSTSNADSDFSWLADELSPHMRTVAAAAAEPDGRIIVPRRSGCLIAHGWQPRPISKDLSPSDTFHYQTGYKKPSMH